MLPFLVAGLLFAFTTAIAFYVHQLSVARDTARFANAVQRTVDSIQERTHTYIGLLRGTAAFFASSREVTKSEFASFAEKLDLRNNYPGIQGIGFAQRLEGADLSNQVAQIRSQGLADFTVSPPGERTSYVAIVYLEPQDWRNLRAIGYDMLSEPVRQETMRRAAIEGRPTLSGKVTLVQETETDVQPGFLLYVPIYQGGKTPPSSEARQSNLVGFAYSPFRAGDLFRGLLATELEPRAYFEIFDGPEASPEALLFQSSGRKPSNPSRSQTVQLQVAGRAWTLRLYSTPAFEAGSNRSWVGWIFASGTLMSLALSGATSLLLRSRQAEKQAAQNVASERERLQVTLASIGDGVVSTDPAGKIVFMNGWAEQLTGWSFAEARGRLLPEVFQTIDEQTLAPLPNPVSKVLQAGRPSMASVNSLLLTRAGEKVPISERVAPMRAPSGEIIGVVLVFQDISGRRRDEKNLQVQYAVTQALANSDSLDEAFPLVLKACCAHLGWDFGAFWKVNARGTHLQCQGFHEHASARVPHFKEATQELRLAKGDSVPGRIWATGKPVWIPDVSRDQGFARQKVAALDGLHSGLAFAIILQGRFYGVLEFYSCAVKAEKDFYLETHWAIASNLSQFLERIRLRGEMEESEIRKTAILETALDCVVTIDEEDRVVDWNPAAERTFGFSKQEALGQSMPELIIPPRFREHHARGMKHYKESGHGPLLGKRVEVIAQRKGGSEFPVELAILPIRVGTKQLFTSYVRDLTPIQEARQALQESEERFRVIVESAQDHGIFTLDLAGKVNTWNPGAERIFGFTEAEMIGRSGAILFTAEDRAKQKPEEEMTMARQKGRALDERWHLRKDGSTFFASGSMVPLRGSNGEVTGYLKIVRDQTEQRQAQQALQESEANLEKLVAIRTARLQETVQELETFSYTISHDLRGPLRAMQGYSEVLLGDYGEQVGPDGRRLLERIVTAGKRMDSLILDVLQYSKVVRSDLVLEAVDTEMVVRDILAHFPNLHSDHATVLIESPLLPVKAHEASLVQCLSNLLGNAVKFVPPGVRPEVRISTKASNGRVKIWVEDNGVGIAAKDYERIFGIFQRVHSEKHYQGTGIGLAIVKKAVERMGGRIGVESEVGKGSRFWLELEKG